MKVISTMDRFTSRSFWKLLLALIVAFVPGSTGAPQGCGDNVTSLYFNLCDVGVIWGIVLEAFATAGVLVCLIMLMVLFANLPFLSDSRRRRSVPLDAGLLVGTLGLFGLSFAFIVGQDFATCTSRNFLFGVLFAACFSCLLMKAINANILSRYNKAPPAWALCLGALALWLVEVIINTEWLVITMVSQPIVTAGMPVPCMIANKDFVMALIYVMVLLVAVLVASSAILFGEHQSWHKDAVYILLTGMFSLGIWVAWIVMYTYGNGTHGSYLWNDPTLTIALVANAWVFLLLYTVPVLCQGPDDSDGVSSLPTDVFANHPVGYENILKGQGSQNMFMDNKAFSMDEPKAAGNKPVSPYSGYNGQMRNSVYQPTELAIITKGVTNVDHPYSLSIPRASLASNPSQSGNISPEQSNTGQKPVTNGNGLHWKSQW